MAAIWAAAITAAGSVASAALAPKKSPGAAGEMGGMGLDTWFNDASMNNDGWIVTTGGSTASASTSSSRATSPSASLTQPGGLAGMLGYPAGGGGTGNDLLFYGGIGLLVLMLLKKK